MPLLGHLFRWEKAQIPSTLWLVMMLLYSMMELKSLIPVLGSAWRALTMTQMLLIMI
jgi:hypothetical protein